MSIKEGDMVSIRRDKGGVQELHHKFRYQILSYMGGDTGILIGITPIYERHLWNKEVKVI